MPSSAQKAWWKLEGFQKNLSGQNQDNVALHTLYEIVNGKDKFPSKFDSDNDEDSES